MAVAQKEVGVASFSGLFCNQRVLLGSNSHLTSIGSSRKFRTIAKSSYRGIPGWSSHFDLAANHLRAQEAALRVRMPHYEEIKKQWEQYQRDKSGPRGGTPWEDAYKKANADLERALFKLDEESVSLTFKANKRVRDVVPVSPPRFRLMLYSFILGIALAIGLPFLLEFLDQTVTNMDKLEAETHMKGLGLVPDFEETIAEAYPLLGSDTMTDPDMLENFRVIRTNLIASAATPALVRRKARPWSPRISRFPLRRWETRPS